MKRTIIIALIGLIALSSISIAVAERPVKVDAFVCPVLGGNAGMHGNSGALTYIGDGNPPFYTRVGPDVSVPIHATNRLPNGTAGQVHIGPHAAPGDKGYTAIWSRGD